MKRIVKVSCLFLLLSITSCYDQEVYSDVPHIEFESLRFYDLPTGAGSDSLVLTFKFQDGGSNIGIIVDEDIFPPYNEFNFFLDDNDSIVTADNYENVMLPVYKVPAVLKNLAFDRISGSIIYFNVDGENFALFGFNRDTLTNLNDLPQLECPNISNQEGALDDFNFLLYDFIEDTLFAKKVQVEGAILVERLDTHFNLIIEFEEKNNSGEYKPFSFQETFEIDDCDIGNFSAQVPIFDANGESGRISYRMNTVRFVSAFLSKDMRISFYIIDRKFNVSNKESYEFTLPAITQ
jgi:hypothetical protein